MKRRFTVHGSRFTVSVLVIAITIMIAACDTVQVKTHRGFMGPDTWEATDGKVSVNYYNGNCCCVAQQVLINLADRANSGQLDWSKMADPQFRAQVLDDECIKTKGK